MLRRAEVIRQCLSFPCLAGIWTAPG